MPEILNFADRVPDTVVARQEIGQHLHEKRHGYVDLLYGDLAGATLGLELRQSPRQLFVVIIDRHAMHQPVTHGAALIEVVNDHARFVSEPLLLDHSSVEHVLRELNARDVSHVGRHEMPFVGRPSCRHPNQLLKVDLDRVPDDRYGADRPELPIIEASAKQATEGGIIGVERIMVGRVV